MNKGSCCDEKVEVNQKLPPINPLQPENKKKIDPSTMDQVKATQFGYLERLKELNANGELEVNQKDQENVTLLHWAAINNRKEVALYLLEKGDGYLQFPAYSISQASGQKKK